MNSGHIAGYRSSATIARAGKRPEVKKRIRELQQRNVRKMDKIMSDPERMARLSELARANLVDFIDENGDIILNKDIPNHGAVSEYEVKTRIIPGDIPITETTKKIKLHNPVPPIDLMFKHDHTYSETAGNTFNQINILVKYDTDTGKESDSPLKELGQAPAPEKVSGLVAETDNS
jgi:hypothetical protein